MRINRASAPSSIKTHEGAPATLGSPMDQLRRSVLSCLLWEDTFYEGGMTIAERIRSLVELCCDQYPDHPGKPNKGAQQVAQLAIEARHSFKLRHAPLWLLNALLGLHRSSCDPAKEIYPQVISRADEMGELLSMYRASNPKRALSAQLKRGLAQALAQFDEYQLAKYDRAKDKYHLRDIIRLVHPKPVSELQSQIWARTIAGTLETPNTWEVRLSSGEDKKQVFTELLLEKRLGYLALLRNLRNMEEAWVDHKLITQALKDRKGAERVLPFRFLSAIEHAPQHAQVLNEAMLASVDNQETLAGTTVVCVDISGSMMSAVSAKTTMARWKVAASLAALINPGDTGTCRLIVFATGAKEVECFRGLAGIKVVENQLGQMGYGTDIAAAINLAVKAKPARIILISDMQSATMIGPIGSGIRGYGINVGTYQPSVQTSDRWTFIDGWSENTLRYIHNLERSIQA